MRIDKILRIALPLLAGTALIGTGYSIFSFANLSTSATFDTNGPAVSVSGKADVGTLEVKPVQQNVNINTGEVTYSEFTMAKYLIIMQNRVYLNFSHFELTYTPPTTNWEEGITIPVVITAKMVLNGKLPEYFHSNAWTEDQANSGTYLFTVGTYDVKEGEPTVVHQISPTLDYKEGKDPQAMADVLNIQNDIIDDPHSVVSFTFTASLRSNLPIEETPGA